VQAYARPASDYGYDVLAVDNLNMENMFGACGFYRNGHWVQRYTGTLDDPQWSADMLNWLAQMQSAVHALPHPLELIPNLGIATNSITDPQVQQLVQQVVSHVDGILDESGFTNYGNGYVTDNVWVQTIQLIKNVQRQHKPYFIGEEFDDNATWVKRDHVQWALSSYLMCKDHLAALFISSKQDYGGDRRRAEFSAKIGMPQGDMYQDQNVYWRDYTGGVVIVNPSSVGAYSITLNSSRYADLYGKHVGQTLTMLPHSGMVLLLK